MKLSTKINYESSKPFAWMHESPVAQQPSQRQSLIGGGYASRLLSAGRNGAFGLLR